MRDKDEELVEIPEWVFWSDARFRLEGCLFARRVLDRMKSSLVYVGS